jgi:hypothetical protein
MITTMKRRFELNGFQIATYTDLRAKLTTVTIVKGEEVLLNAAFEKAPFAIDYAALIENL